MKRILASLSACLLVLCGCSRISDGQQEELSVPAEADELAAVSAIKDEPASMQKPALDSILPLEVESYTVYDNARIFYDEYPDFFPAETKEALNAADGFTMPGRVDIDMSTVHEVDDAVLVQLKCAMVYETYHEKVDGQDVTVIFLGYPDTPSTDNYSGVMVMSYYIGNIDLENRTWINVTGLLTGYCDFPISDGSLMTGWQVLISSITPYEDEGQ